MTMEKTDYKRTKLICYFANLAMSSVFSLPPMLFATFREMYGISYTLLGTLVLVNFCTQLGIDLVFSFFSGYFNIHKTIRLMPLITAAGLCIYALVPMLFPRYAYLGLITGTCVFSVAAGLGEVLVSPTVAAIPSDNPDKDMSMLHALYGYGFVGVVLISTLFLRFVGKEYWMYLTFFWAALPVVASLLLMGAPLPDMDMGQSGAKAAGSKYRTKGLLLCMGCIFLGACAENTMSNWVSVYAEIALGIPKIWGDILGMSLFAALLALTRTVYAKYGKNIFKFVIIIEECLSHFHVKIIAIVGDKFHALRILRSASVSTLFGFSPFIGRPPVLIAIFHIELLPRSIDIFQISCRICFSEKFRIIIIRIRDYHSIPVNILDSRFSAPIISYEFKSLINRHSSEIRILVSHIRTSFNADRTINLALGPISHLK